MITHQTLYNLANALGVLAMLTVVGYHFVSVNARHLAKKPRWFVFPSVPSPPYANLYLLKSQNQNLALQSIYSRIITTINK